MLRVGLGNFECGYELCFCLVNFVEIEYIFRCGSRIGWLCFAFESLGLVFAGD